MATEILIPGEAKVINDILEKKSKIQNARNLYCKQWMVNLAFLYGKSHFIAESKKITSGVEERILWELRSEERKNKTKKSSNYILPLYRSLLSRMLMMKANITVEPTTSTQEDKAAARVSNEVLEDFWQMANKHNPILCKKTGGMYRVMFRLFSALLSCGRGYLMPYFNDKTVSKTVMNGQVIEGPIGEVETKVFTPFNIFEDPLGMHLIEETVMPVEMIQDQYNIEVKPEELAMTEAEQELLNILEGNSNNSNISEGARVLQYWALPTKKNPQGRHVITTASKLISDTGIPPEYKGRIPYFSFDYLDLLASSFPQGMIDQLISNQEDYNYTLSRLYSYKKWFAGKLKVPKKCKLETKYDDEVGQIIYYDQGYGEPHFEAPPSPPSFLMDELIRIRKDMEDIAGVHDSNMTPVRSKGKSGVAIENLTELDNSQFSPILMGIENQLSFFAETVLDIMEAKYPEPRLVAITGDNLGSDVNSFIGENVKGNRRIKITMGSQFPLQKAERQAFIMMLADKGYIDRSKAMELMEFGDLAGAYISIDENAQKQEIKEIIKGVDVVPEQYEYHPTHIKVLEDYLKSEEYKKLDDAIKQELLKHYQIHQKYFQIENQAAAQMQGGQGGK